MNEELEGKILDLLLAGSDDHPTLADDMEVEFVLKIIADAIRLTPLLTAITPKRMKEREQAVASNAQALLKTPGIMNGDMKRKLEVLRDYHEARGRQIEVGKGKFKPKQVQRFIANALCDGYETGNLRLKPAVSRESQFARLFRICCEAANVSGPSNLTTYINQRTE